jgi:hypothetical protein
MKGGQSPWKSRSGAPLDVQKKFFLGIPAALMAISPARFPAMRS